MNTFEISNINFFYGKKHILNDVSISSIKQGMLVALIGPNAAGKSSLLKCISGINKTDSGKIQLNDQNLNDVTVKERFSKVCFMPQFFSTNAALTVFEVVLMSYKQLTGWAVSTGDRYAVSQVLEQTGIGHLAGTNIANLSGGQAQLVSLCQALVREAQVYLFDEPTSALDLRHQLEGLNKIRTTIKSKNCIGIVALHDLNLAARFADQIILLGEGKVLAQGLPKDVLRHPVISETYGVNINILTTEDNNIHVSASL